MKRDLCKETFPTAEQLCDRVLVLIAGQRVAIAEGVASDTCMDGLAINSCTL
ncbi:MAG: hypothetical protein GY696_27675 [Gammaproteobacteria bacterium]|nr:hypothetical protein [Gammaproteobacteria bacterium]